MRDDDRALVGLVSLFWFGLMLSICIPIVLCGWLTLAFTDRVVGATPCECEATR